MEFLNRMAMGTTQPCPLTSQYLSNPSIVGTKDDPQPCGSMSSKRIQASSSNLSSHHYEPLDRQKKSIRLLQVLPGEEDDTIKCEHHHCDLNSQLGYQALSYMWDHEGDQVPIICDGKPLTVGNNLWKFMQMYRRTHTNSDTWL